MEICLNEYQKLSTVEKNSESFEYLDPGYRQKSFYKKARVFKYKNGVEVLVSYSTPVVVYVPESDAILKLQQDDRYTTSPTTMKHINAFLDRVGKLGTYGMSVREWRKIAV